MRFRIGDRVEVFYRCSWKVGAIFDILSDQKEIKRNRKHRTLQKRYIVRLFGCKEDLVINSSNIRMRQTCHDGKWILMGKNSRSGDDVIASKPSMSNCFRKTGPQHNARPKKIRRTVQESTQGYSVFEAHNGRAQKLRAIEKVDENSDGCSVGSCSIATQYLKTLNSRFLPMHTSDLGSDAESFHHGSGSGREKVEELEVSICEIELHAYRSTLGALYASGPLSWEQEAMLTNLRIMLHISNDQHLKELKNLISNKTNCY
ncbi:hypothetical protein CASFOL_022201 [Castilleja foliolosa]|uniref:ENT domain-containing protein n=1 Tax=Castilleja foliolosa TaxID=1961234 RepID=A0ABD3CWI2_9LAMI